jgi:hypothetical protein
MISNKCKYCGKSLDNKIMYQQSNTGELNCHECEIMCVIAVDMISQGIHSIGGTITDKNQPERLSEKTSTDDAIV